MLRRRFGRPRRIDEHERIWLVGEGLCGRAEVRVNGESLGSSRGGSFEFPMTHLISERNELTIDLIADSPDDGLQGDVAVEIRCRAYLSDVRGEWMSDGRLRIIGQVCGEAERDLDVYVVAGDRPAAYVCCSVGQWFDLVTHEPVEPSVEVRVELVAGPIMWDAVKVASG
jgi:hypothetical protein